MIAQGSELSVIEELEISGIGGSLGGAMQREGEKGSVSGAKVGHLSAAPKVPENSSEARRKLEETAEEVRSRPEILPLLPHLLG